MASLVCEKCGRELKDTEFYTKKDGSKTSLCKKCLTMHVDNFNPDTFTWILKEIDVPYIPGEWNTLRDKAFEKAPNKMNGLSVIGKYLSKMKLVQYKKYHWADTDKAVEEWNEKHEQKQEQEEEQARILKQQLEDGIITKAQYETLMPTPEKQRLAVEASISGNAAQAQNQGNNYYDETQFLSEEEIDPSSELTKEDKLYLAIKWGRLYRPSEWIELERKYNEMMQSFDIQDSDTVGSLILICKTFLKMNQAIDSGDVDGYQKLSRTYSDLRKSAKFTAAQNKETNTDFVDSVGEIVAYCEEHGGQIPRYDISIDYDKVDTVIRDLKAYTKSLIFEDMALGRQIEDYLKKREISDQQAKDRAEAKSKGREVEVSDEDYQQHLEMIEEAKKIDQITQEGEEE